MQGNNETGRRVPSASFVLWALMFGTYLLLRREPDGNLRWLGVALAVIALAAAAYALPRMLALVRNTSSSTPKGHHISAIIDLVLAIIALLLFVLFLLRLWLA